MTWRSHKSKGSRKHSPVYTTEHGTTKLFKDFDFSKAGLGFHFGRGSQSIRILYKDGTEGRVMKVKIDLKNPMKLNDMEGWEPLPVWEQAKSREYVTSDESFENDIALPKNFDQLSDTGREEAWQKRSEMLRNKFLDLGYDGIIYLNRFEDWDGDPPGEYPQYKNLTDEQLLSLKDESGNKMFEGGGFAYIVFKPEQIKILSHDSQNRFPEFYKGKKIIGILPADGEIPESYKGSDDDDDDEYVED